MKIWTVSPPASNSSWSHWSPLEYCWEKWERPLELVTHLTASGKEALVVLQLTFLTTFTNPLTSSNSANLREVKRQKAEQRVSSQITSFQTHETHELQDLKCWYLNYHIALTDGLLFVHLTLLSCMCLFAIRKAYTLFNGCHHFERGQLKVV